MTAFENAGERGQNKVFFRGGFWLIIFGAAILASVIYRYSRVFLRLEDQYTFIGQNVLNVLILAAIAAQVLIYRRQWDAMQATLKQGREIAEREQAAYVLFDKGSISRYKIGESIAALVIFKNVGKTPARDVTIYGHLEHRTTLPDVYQAIKKSRSIEGRTEADFSKYVIAQDGSAELPFDTNVLSQELWNDIQQKGERCYIWGAVTYKDVFNRDRRTYFSLAQHRTRKDKLEFCATGNEIN